MKPKIYIFNRFRLLLVVLMLMAKGVGILGCYAGNKSSSSSMSELRQELNHMFAKLNRNVVPTGLLRDYAIEYENLDSYDVTTNRNSEKVCDVVSYFNVLNTLQSSSLQDVPFKAFITEYEKSKAVSPNLSIVRLSVVLYEYAQIKANALKDHLISYKQGQVYNASKKAFQLRKVYASCILDNEKTTNNVSFTLPKQFILSNIGVTNVEVDYGNGYQSIIDNKVYAYLSNGIHHVKIKLTDKYNNVYFTDTNITVAEKSSLQTRSMSNMYSWSGSYKGVTTYADVSIYKSRNNYSGKLKKPFIFVEGFDPRELNSEGRGSMYDDIIWWQWHDFINRNSYDFIYVDWRSPGEYIQANAYTLIEVLKKIKDMSDESTQPILLVGHSMGGLIARYALKTMENQHISHGVGTYVSYDAPHLGANVPQSLLYGYYSLTKFLKEKNVIGSLAKKNEKFSKLLSVGERMAYSTATQQMLVDYIDPSGRLNNDEHIRWQKELAELGFPRGDAGRDFQMLGIANSDYSQYAAPKYYLDCDFSAGSTLGGVIGGVAGSTLGSIVGVGYLPITDILSLAVGICFQDVIVGLLSYLPGRDSAKGNFYCLPASSVGQKITHFELEYQKDFMWLVPIKKTVFSYNGYYSGSCLFDTYPSSMYGISKTTQGISQGEIPLIFDYGVGVNVSPCIPFIPSASALACGDGTKISPSTFTTKPSVESTPFGLNYYLEDNPLNQEHSNFSFETQNWIETHLGISIDGPLSGYTGAKYTLVNSDASVVWNSSDASIATIDQQGVLTVKKNGTVQILAQSDGVSYSKNIIVGMPRYVLSSKHEPDGFKIEASCIDQEFQDNIETVNKIVQFQWAVKFPDKSIDWNTTNSSSIFIPLEYKDAVVLFKVCDSNGNESEVQSVKATGNNVFLATNNHIKVDANKNLYKENGSSYSYKRGKVYLTRDKTLPADYQRATWTAMEAVVFSPFSNQYNIIVDSGEIMLKDILPEEEMNYLVNNLEVGQTYSYTIALLNPQKKIIQFLPFTVTLK